MVECCHCQGDVAEGFANFGGQFGASGLHCINGSFGVGNGGFKFDGGRDDVDSVFHEVLFPLSGLRKTEAIERSTNQGTIQIATIILTYGCCQG